MASNLGAETAGRNTKRERSAERGAAASRFWLNAFIGDAPGEKNQSPQSSHRHCPRCRALEGGRERGGLRVRVASEGGGGKGLRAIPPALRHTSIPPGDSHGVNGESRNLVATKRSLPGNNNTPPPLPFRFALIHRY